MDITKFNEKLNKVDGNIYVIEEVVTPVNGVYEAELIHDNVNLTTLNVYTGSKLTGDKINTYTTSTPSLTPWKTVIKIFSNANPLYISYETSGDQVEAEDINKLQDTVVDTQTALNSEIDRATNRENQIETNLNLEISRAENAENTLTINLNSEIARAKSAENTITNNLNSEVSRAQNAESTLASNLNNEVNRAKAAESTLTSNLNSEITRATNAENTLTNNLNSEINRAKAAENTLTNTINTNKPIWDDKYTKNEIDNKFNVLTTNLDWKESVATFSAIETTYPTPDDGWTVNVKDTDITYRYDGSAWIPISANSIPLATSSVDGKMSKQDKIDHDDMVSKRHTHSNKSILDIITQTLIDNWNAAFTHVSDAVRHITSTERSNWNTAYSNNHTHSNKSVLDSVTQALIDTWNAAYTHISDSIKHITSAERTLWNTVSNKVDKITGKSLSTNDFDNNYKSKVDGISSNANKVETSTTNGNIKIDSVEKTVYIHPSGTNPHGTTKADVGLSNVDNTSDLNKPISTAVQNALDVKAPNGYGLGTMGKRLATSTDLNTVKSNGWYDVQTPINSPYSGGWVKLLVIASADINYITQMAFGMVNNLGRTYTRTLDAGTWGSWYELYSTLNKPTPNDIGASPTSHTHDDRYYTETEADGKFATKSEISTAGYGDMLKSIYDTNGDGIVDNADKLDGKHASDFASSGYGVGEYLQAKGITNANTAMITGWYYFTGATNSPVGTGDGNLMVIAHSSSWIHQIFFEYNGADNGRIFMRKMNNGVWKSWYQVARIGDIPTSLPANGGTSASCSGNAATATKLQTARTINGISFDGTTNITITDNTKVPKGCTWNDLEGV